MTETVVYKTNPPLRQNVIQTAFGNWQRHHDLLFPPQRAIYRNLADRMVEGSVVEYGCGIGVGSCLLARLARGFRASDVSQEHIEYASCLYPDLFFVQHDLVTGPLDGPFKIAVAIELIEHIEDDETALRALLTSPEVWLSTPNRQAPGMGRERPNNRFHVREYTPDELIETMHPFLRGRDVVLHEPETFAELNTDTTCTPVVYHVH